MTTRFRRAFEVAVTCALSFALSFGASAGWAAAQSAPEPSESSQLETIDAAPQLVKARGLFETRAFGATGDGRTDDTEALQKAIDAAEAAHGVVLLDPPAANFGGHYLVTRPLVISSPLALTGLSRTTGIYVRSLDFDVFSIHAPQVDLSHFRIVALPGATGSGGNAFRVTHSQGVEIHDIIIVGLWNGLLNESSGALTVESVGFQAGDFAPSGAPRYGFKATAAGGGGNPNLTRFFACIVSNYGQHPRTVDGFVIADGYNSVTVDHGGVLQGNRAYWSTAESGRLPNFLEINNAVSDHSAVGLQLDQGRVTSMMNTLITSSSDAAVRIAPAYRTGSITLVSNKILANHLGLQIDGGNTISINGGEISTVGGGDAIVFDSDATVALGSLNITGIQGAALHVTAGHRAGWITVTAVNEHDARAALEVDAGTQGGYTISGNAFADPVRDAGANPKRAVGSNGTR
jgi:hypothetical protein